MVNSLAARHTERFFITISCIEHFTGLMMMCQVTLPFSRYIMWIFTLFYIAIIATKKYTIKEKIIFIILIVFGVLLYINTGLSKGIRAVCYLYALKDTNMKKYFQAMLSVLVASTLFAAVCSKVRVFRYFVIHDVRADRGFNGWRYSFGYESPNTTMAVVFWALICVLVLHHTKQTLYVYVTITVLYILYFYLTDCRTAFIIGTAVMIGMICVNNIKWSGWTDLIFVIFITSFILMLAVSIAAAFHVENILMSKIDYFISGRMNQLTEHVINNNYALPYVENWHLFGDRANLSDYDMGYIQIFYYYGIVPAICYLSCVVCAAVKVWRDKDAWKLILMLGLIVHLFMESLYLSNYIPIDFLLVYAVSLLWGDYGEKAGNQIFDAV